jgi:hypothetical protein
MGGKRTDEPMVEIWKDWSSVARGGGLGGLRERTDEDSCPAFVGDPLGNSFVGRLGEDERGQHLGTGSARDDQ